MSTNLFGVSDLSIRFDQARSSREQNGVYSLVRFTEAATSRETVDLEQHRLATMDRRGLLERMIEAKRWIDQKLQGIPYRLATLAAQSHEDGSDAMTCFVLRVSLQADFPSDRVLELNEEACDFVADSTDVRARSEIIVQFYRG